MTTTTTKPFSRLSAAGKRVAIAKDVLKQLKAEKYVVQKGVWCDIETDSIDLSEVQADQTSLLSGRVTVPIPPCRVCAMGAAMVSSIRLGNIGSVSAEASAKEVTKQAKRFFSAKQMRMIEGAFEGRKSDGGGCGSIDAPDDFPNTRLTEKEWERQDAFIDAYPETDGRFEAIFRNIIRNNGEFKP